MSQELQLDLSIPGQTIYFLIRNSVASIWNGSSFVGYSTASYATYAIAATQQGTASGFYVASFPSGIAGGVYSIVAKIQAGGSPAETDQSVGWQNYQWDGANAVALAPAQTTYQKNMATTMLTFNNSGLTNTAAVHSPLNALRKLINKWDTSVSGGAGLAVYQEDALTPAYVQTIVSLSGAAPITSLGDG